MPTNIIMPALELAQETGKVLRWLKSPGEAVQKGEPIVEIETDKVTVEIEAPASGVLRDVTARQGDVVPVGQTIAMIVAAGEVGGGAAGARSAGRPAASATVTGAVPSPPAAVGVSAGAVKASPLARKLAEQHGVDLTRVRTASGRIEKADVLAYVASQTAAPAGNGVAARLAAASPKARRLAAERGVDISMVPGSGPGGAVLVADVPTAARRRARARPPRPPRLGPGRRRPRGGPSRRGERAPRPRRRHGLAHHGRAHDDELDYRAAFLSRSRGQREPPGLLAGQGA